MTTILCKSKSDLHRKWNLRGKVDILVVPGSRFNFPISWPSENNSALFRTAAQDKAKRREKTPDLGNYSFPVLSEPINNNENADDTTINTNNQMGETTDDDDDIYIMMKCLSVCLSRTIIAEGGDPL